MLTNEQRKKLEAIDPSSMVVIKAKAKFIREIEKLLRDVNPDNKYIDPYIKSLKNCELTRLVEYAEAIRVRKQCIPLVLPNFENSVLDINKLFAVAKERGVKIFQRVWVTDGTKARVLSTIPRPLLWTKGRRQQQHLLKKIAISTDNNTIDERTGQVTGDSAASGLSFPESQVLYASQAKYALLELLKFRGGDSKAFRALLRDAENGMPSMVFVDSGYTKVRSTAMLNVLWRTAHIDSNF